MNPLVEVIGSVDVGDDGAEAHNHTVSDGDGCWGERVVFDTLVSGIVTVPHFYRTCLMRAVNSWTRLYTERSSRIMRAIFDVA